MLSYHVDHDLSLRCHFGILKRTFSLVVGSKYDITICDVILVVNKLACKSLYSLSQYTYMITPDCDLYYKRGVLHDNEPKFSRFTGKITRKSSKRWTQVEAMPE